MTKAINLMHKYSIITGASGFIGSSVAVKLANHGSNLILIDINDNQLNRLSTKIKKLNKKIKIDTITSDISKESEINNLIKYINMNYNKIDIMVNSIGMVGTDTSDGWNVDYKKQSLESWNKCIGVNLTGIFFLIQGIHKLMRKTKNASIVNISSIYGVIAPDWQMYKGTDIYNPAAYSVSKAGLINMSRWLASTLSPHIRVNCISPGGVLRNQKKIFVKKYSEKTLLKRMANESDISDPVLFLASDMSSYITGHNLIVDGGFTIK
tara:strand:- start:417 stop:1214 length:798 start_codon:yes stop_codon:yes gene_type:complete